MMEAIHSLRHATASVVHYPCDFYDDQMTAVGDYVSHRNIPNGAGRDKKVERLYLFGNGAIRTTHSDEGSLFAALDARVKP